MSAEYVLIDYENVQPKNLEILAKHPFSVFIFFGENQTKVSRDFFKSMLLLRNRAEVIEMSGSGSNALDFHIAYYLGELTAKDPKAQFHVISKDKGFDPLIRHLKGKGVEVRRETDLAEIPLLRIKETTSDEEKIDSIVRNLAARGQSRPRKVKTLENTINTLFARKLEKSELTALINELQKRKHIVINQGNVSYKLPH